MNIIACYSVVWNTGLWSIIAHVLVWSKESCGNYSRNWQCHTFLCMCSDLFSWPVLFFNKLKAKVFHVTKEGLWLWSCLLRLDCSVYEVFIMTTDVVQRHMIKNIISFGITSKSVCPSIRVSQVLLKICLLTSCGYARYRQCNKK